MGCRWVAPPQTQSLDKQRTQTATNVTWVSEGSIICFERGWARENSPGKVAHSRQPTGPGQELGLGPVELLSVYVKHCKIWLGRNPLHFPLIITISAFTGGT